MELKASGKGVPYLRMTFEEEIGRGSQARTQEIQVWAWNALARQLKVTRDKALKLRLSQWGFVDPHKRAEKAYSFPAAYGNAEVIDGDRETLPA